MVLGRAFLIVASIVAASGCNQSLFDSHGGSGSDGPGPIAETCQAPCVGDAAAEYDGTSAGSTGHWRYLDDHRDRTWAAMTAGSDGTMAGVDTANTIGTCAARGNAGPCADLPGALLLSSSGSTSDADPAIELTVPTTEVVQITVHARVGDGQAPQQIRLYRNSREDVLATQVASPGTTLDLQIKLDALAGDRFLVAVAPATVGADQIALHMFVSGTGETFPLQCQMAVTFASATGNAVENQCGGSVTSYDATGTAAPPTLAAGPFVEEGMAANVAVGNYYSASATLDKSGDTTTQLWVDPGVVGADAQFMISDHDLDVGGGLALALFIDSNDNMLKLDVSTCSSPSPLTFDGGQTPFPADQKWHFLRAVHTGGNVLICLDGTRVFSFPVAAGKLASTYPPYLAKNVIWTPAGAFYGGGIDDVRVFSTALPCD